MKVLSIMILLVLHSHLSWAEEALSIEAHPYLVEMPSDVVFGDDKAPSTVIEYSSLSCPHCAYFHQNVFAEFKTKFIDTGKVKYIHRDFPIDQVAMNGTILARCAGKDRYYVFLKVLFDKQSSWAGQKNYQEILENIGKLGGVSGEKLQGCMHDKALENDILQSKLSAMNILKVNSTPTFFINGNRYVGAQTLEDLTKIINAPTTVMLK